MGASPSLSIFLLFLLILGVYLFYIFRARRGATVNIRPIAGLSAIDEAIGRATEMGRPVHFTLGMSRFYPDTFAAFAILRYIAEKCAQMGTTPIITNSVVTVHLATEEILRSAYAQSDHPDAFRTDMVRFIAKDAFPYVAGALETIETEKPAANIMIGTFGAATLLLAEGGRLLGPIQISGTDDLEQLPFYFVCCDYTLIGEEIFGAGAHLSGDPTTKGNLAGQDLMRIIIIALILLFIIFGLFGWNAPFEWFMR
jgi:hypothetical protein